MLTLLSIIFLIGLCWGSFLNVLAHRILHGKTLFTRRSYCPSCEHIIAWYDNIPLISWLWLYGKCRLCKTLISYLYPFTELTTAALVTGCFYKLIIVPFPLAASMLNNPHHFFSFMTAPMYQTLAAHIIFMSALVAATRTDLEAMVIPQLFSLWLVPFGLVFSYAGLTNVTLLGSALGALIGFGLLWIVAQGFKILTHKEGMGIGDMELLALIGSFLGPIGVWMSVMIASFSGLVVGSIYLAVKDKDRTTRIPFGPFLALGAIVYFFCDSWLVEKFLGI